MRKVKFANGEYYHIYNRGVDKRDIFTHRYDLERFFQSMGEFNTLNPIGSIYENQFRKRKSNLNIRLGSLASKFSLKSEGELIRFVCYCLNPNHFHFLLQQVAEHGIEKFMHRLGSGYTNYFNKRYNRTGALFQGQYKATHVNTDRYLLHVSVYVNLNNKVHKIMNGLWQSSWEEYIRKSDKSGFCAKDIILNQFQDTFTYQNFAENSIQDILERRSLYKELQGFLGE